MHKRIYLLLSIVFLSGQLVAQTFYGSFTVGGNSSNYYPVLFSVSGVDGTSSLGKLSVYIDDVHTNGSWSGSFHSEIEFISSNWGHMNTKLVSLTYVTGNGSLYNDPIGDIADGSTAGGGSQMVLWLRGGATYQWSTTYNSRVIMEDGNSGGVTKTSASGSTLSILNSQSQLVANAKNNKLFQNVGLSVTGTGYFGGFLGVGINTPQYPLHVISRGNTGSASSFLYGDNYGVAIGTNDISSNYYALNVLSGISASGSSGVSRFLVRNDGNVGIGTTSPTEKLVVNGNIRSRKIIVTQTGWPDYVFEKKYKLLPLNEVRRYIEENKHLPDVPSVDLMTTKGNDLGETQAILLKKIEELTLYLLQLEKRNSELEIRVKKLENKK